MESRINSGLSHGWRRDPNLANKSFEWTIPGVDFLENNGTIGGKEFLYPVPNILHQQDSVANSNRGNATRRSHDWDSRCGCRGLSEKSKRRPRNKKNRNILKVIERIRGIRGGLGRRNRRTETYVKSHHATRKRVGLPRIQSGTDTHQWGKTK